MADPNFSPVVRSWQNQRTAGSPQMPTYTHRGLKPVTYYEQSEQGFPVKVTISRKGNVYRNMVYPSGWPASLVNQQQDQSQGPFGNQIDEEKFKRFLGF